MHKQYTVQSITKEYNSYSLSSSESTMPEMEVLATATTAEATSTASEEHLEYLRGIVMTATETAASLINLFDIHALIILIAFSCIREHLIGLSDILEHAICILFVLLIISLMFVRMPFESSLPVCLLNLVVIRVLRNIQYAIVVFAF